MVVEWVVLFGWASGVRQCTMFFGSGLVGQLSELSVWQCSQYRPVLLTGGNFFLRVEFSCYDVALILLV